MVNRKVGADTVTGELPAVVRARILADTLADPGLATAVNAEIDPAIASEIVRANSAYVPNTSLAAETIRTADATALTPWRAALANRDNVPARILFVGDSRTEGEGATTVGNRWQNKVAATLRSRFPVTGGNPAYASANYVPVKYISPTLAGQSLFSAPAGGTFYETNNFGLGTRVIDLRAGANTTLTFTGTSCKIAYVRAATAGSFTYAVNGGSAVTVSWAAGSTQDGQLVSLGPFTAGVHTVLITGVTGSAYIAGAYVYNGEETKGIQVFDAGHHGVTSNTIIGAGAFYFTQTVANVDPHCVYIGVGTNDYGGIH